MLGATHHESDAFRTRWYSTPLVSDDTPQSTEDAASGFLRRKPKQSRSRAMVQSVVQAFDEFLTRGERVQDLTVDALSRRAGVGIGSFYEYFRDKDSLLGVLIGQVTQRNFDRLAAELDHSRHPELETAVRAVSREVTAVYLEHPARLSVIVRGIGRLDLLKLVTRERDRFALLMADLVHEYLPDEAPTELQLTMKLVADAVTAIVVFEAERDPPESIDVVSERVADVALGIMRQRHPDWR